MSLVSDPTGPAVIVIEGGDDGTGSIVVISEQGPPGPAGSPGIGGSALDDLLAQLEAEIAQREADKAELDAMDAALDGQAQAINTTLQGHIDSVTGAVVAEETRATAREDAIEGRVTFGLNFASSCSIYLVVSLSAGVAYAVIFIWRAI